MRGGARLEVAVLGRDGDVALEGGGGERDVEGDGGDYDVAAAGVELVERRHQLAHPRLVQVLRRGRASEVRQTERGQRDNGEQAQRNDQALRSGTHAFPVAADDRPADDWTRGRGRRGGDAARE